MSYLRSQYLPTCITIQLSNGSCKIRYIMLNSFSVNEFLYILYVNHTTCLHFPRTSIKLSYLYGVCSSPDIYSYHLNVFPGIPRISSFKFIHSYDNMMYVYYYSGPALGGAETNAVLCKTCSVLCVLEQLRIDNSSAEPLMRGDRLGSSNWSN